MHAHLKLFQSYRDLGAGDILYLSLYWSDPGSNSGPIAISLITTPS